MNKKEEAYVCKKCGYVLSKKDAVVSGWDSEGSLGHVHARAPPTHFKSNP